MSEEKKNVKLFEEFVNEKSNNIKLAKEIASYLDGMKDGVKAGTELYNLVNTSLNFTEKDEASFSKNVMDQFLKLANENK